MKIGIVIPYRLDRPLFLENLHRMIKAQTLQPEIVCVVDYEPISNDMDITPRYRKGYDELRGKKVDLIAFMEVDDYYSPNYLEFMANQWILNGKPDILGLNHTIYYHINTFEHFTMNHLTRSSAMNTVINPDLDIKWGHDNDPYTDVWLWNLLKGIIITTETEICLGIKHGVGLCGGQNHTDKMERYINKDYDKSFLRSIMKNDLKSFEFYANYFNPNPRLIDSEL